MSHPHNLAPSLDALFRVLRDLDAPDPEFRNHIDAALTLLEKSAAISGNAEAPFLSVIVRTQGKRSEAFSDALLCLSAQTERRFEVIVVTHDADVESRANVAAVIDDHRPLLPSVEVVHVDGGTRAKPLNAGVEVARGQYIAFFDDDDLLFAHWIETFRSAAESNPGKLLRTVSGTQQVRAEPWPDGRDGFRAVSWSLAEYARDFDPIRNLVANHSPFMSIAFPRRLFFTLGFRFDENLEVCEDWEVIARGASFLGFGSAKAMTSIYRRWEGAATSYTEHSSDAWARAEQKLLARLDSEPTLLPAESVHRLRSLIQDENAARALKDVLSSRSWRMLEPLRGSALRLRVLAARARARIRR